MVDSKVIMRRLGILVLVIGLTTTLSAKDIFGNLMRDGVATFLDAAKLMYYSFKPSGQKERKKKPAEPDEVRAYLKSKGLELAVYNKPIKKEKLAKSLVKRFKLSTGIFTNIFGFDTLYYSDAQKLGIFQRDELGDDILTIGELIKAFIKAEQISLR